MEQFTGTRPVAASHAFDVAALESHLQARLPGFSNLVMPTPMTKVRLLMCRSLSRFRVARQTQDSLTDDVELNIGCTTRDGHALRVQEHLGCRHPMLFAQK